MLTSTSVTALSLAAPMASRLPDKATEVTFSRLVKPLKPSSIKPRSIGAAGLEISASVTAPSMAAPMASRLPETANE